MSILRKMLITSKVFELQVRFNAQIEDNSKTLPNLMSFFVADGINSVGDYNSPPGGCRLYVCVCLYVCPHFFSRFTIG